MSVDWDLPSISDTSFCFCPWWSSKEDTTSSISSGSLGGDPSSLCCLYTSRYKDWISSLLVWGPTNWMVDTSASESSFGNSYWWPQQICLLHLLLPLVCGVSEHFIEHHEVVGAICLPLGLSSRNSSMSITHSASWTDKPSLTAHPLVARALSLLLPYFCINNLWYLQK